MFALRNLSIESVEGGEVRSVSFVTMLATFILATGSKLEGRRNFAKLSKRSRFQLTIKLYFLEPFVNNDR